MKMITLFSIIQDFQQKHISFLSKHSCASVFRPVSGLNTSRHKKRPGTPGFLPLACRPFHKPGLVVFHHYRKNRERPCDTPIALYGAAQLEHIILRHDDFAAFDSNHGHTCALSSIPFPVRDPHIPVYGNDIGSRKIKNVIDTNAPDIKLNARKLLEKMPESFPYGTFTHKSTAFRNLAGINIYPVIPLICHEYCQVVPFIALKTLAIFLAIIAPIMASLP